MVYGSFSFQHCWFYLPSAMWPLTIMCSCSSDRKSSISPLASHNLAVAKLAFLLASLVAQTVKNPPAMWETPIQFLGWENPMEKGEATHSSILGLSW